MYIIPHDFQTHGNQQDLSILVRVVEFVKDNVVSLFWTHVAAEHESLESHEA